jgi:hypothetical protein
MSASANAYWTDTATLDLQTSPGTDMPVAGIQDITIVPSVSIEQLYTADSIKIEQQQQHEFSVDVAIGFSKWDDEVVNEWLGGPGTTATSMTDQSDPQKYKVSSTVESVNGTETYNIEVTGITFEDMPIIDASRGEFIQWDLDGTGEDLTDLSAP